MLNPKKRSLEDVAKAEEIARQKELEAAEAAEADSDGEGAQA